MQKTILLLIIISTLYSCTTIEVNEMCYVNSIIDGEYIIRGEILGLAKDNDTSFNEIDTMYFKVDKKTKFKFKLKDKAEYEAYYDNKAFELEKYIYLKGFNQTEVGWIQTQINHKIPKYDWKRKGICDEDLNTNDFKKIQTELMKKGYLIDPEENPTFNGDFKNAYIKFQKDNGIPYGKIDVETLKKLGIRVRFKVKS